VTDAEIFDRVESEAGIDGRRHGPPRARASAPLVTLAVKGFNQEGIIASAIEAAFAQTYAPLEILLSDDCSSDRTFAVMEQMAAQYRGSHTVVLNRNPTNLGIVGHMNRVAELASGRLIVEGAGDDLSEPQRVERLASVWRQGRGQVKAVHSAFAEIDHDGRALGAGAPDRRILDDPGPDPLTLIRTKANGLGATAAWDRELFDTFGPIPEDCGVEDGVLFFRAALLQGIAYIDEPLVKYRTGGLSRPQERSPGYDYLYGDRIKFLRWTVTNTRSFLRDLERVDFPGKDECRSLCEQILDRHGFEVDLSDGGVLSRLAMLPRAAARTARSGDPYFAAQSVKHALGPAFVAYYNMRHRGSGARREAG